MSTTRHRILVVEDEPIIQIGATSIVEALGFEALAAFNADQAIAILEANQDIRLVFTDVDMPGSMDGLKLAHYIRNRWPPIQIIVASGKAILEESVMPSGSKFFGKPYDEHAIADAITRMLDPIA